MTHVDIELELLPWERAALLRWTLIPEVRSQLEALASRDGVESIRLSPTLVHWLAGDLTHAIVKRGCHDDRVFDLSERLDYVDDTGDGALDSWY